MIIILGMVLHFLGWEGHEARAAGLDYGVSAGVRSYPLGLSAGAQVGYNWKLWGEDPTLTLPTIGVHEDGTGGPWKYGAIRLSTNFQTAVVTNRLFFEAEIYPISIWGVAFGMGGHARINRSVVPFDCSLVQCGGVLARYWGRTQLVLGYKGFFVAGGARIDHFQGQPGTDQFLDEVTNLLGQEVGDELLQGWGVAGFNFKYGWQGLLFSQFAQFLRAQNQSISVNVAAAKYFKGFGLTGGIGMFRSVHQPWGPVFMLNFQWIGKRSMMLF